MFEKILNFQNFPTFVRPVVHTCLKSHGTMPVKWYTSRLFSRSWTWKINITSIILALFQLLTWWNHETSCCDFQIAFSCFRLSASFSLPFFFPALYQFIFFPLSQFNLYILLAILFDKFDRISLFSVDICLSRQ